MGDIFREIDEELRQEKFEKLWREYGKFIIAGAVIVVAIAAGIFGWTDYREGQRAADGLKFSAAVTALQEDKKDDAKALLESLIQDSHSGYGLLAKLQQAALLADGGDRDAAVAIYESIAGDEDFEEHIRNLALMQLAYNTIDTADPGALTARLEPLSAAGNPWRYTALEVMGYLAQRSGDSGKAKEFYQRITDDVSAPAGVRARAAQLLEMVGG